MPQTLTFPHGDRVFYAIMANVYLIGTVTKAERKEGFKPYTIKADDDSREYYANEKYLHAYSVPELPENFFNPKSNS